MVNSNVIARDSTAEVLVNLNDAQEETAEIVAKGVKWSLQSFVLVVEERVALRIVLTFPTSREGRHETEDEEPLVVLAIALPVEANLLAQVIYFLHS